MTLGWIDNVLLAVKDRGFVCSFPVCGFSRQSFAALVALLQTRVKLLIFCVFLLQLVAHAHQSVFA